MCLRTSLQKHLAITGVREMDLMSLGLLMLVDFEQGLWWLISGSEGWWVESLRG